MENRYIGEQEKVAKHCLITAANIVIVQTLYFHFIQNSDCGDEMQSDIQGGLRAFPSRSFTLKA